VPLKLYYLLFWDTN